MDIYEAIKARRSVRKYKSEPVPEDKLRKILNSARLAPSAKNQQPWKFVVVRDEEIKRKLISACNEQKFIAEAPVVLVACALIDDCYGFLGGYSPSYQVDIASAVSHLILTAASEGLGTCWIGNFKEDKVKEILGIPENVRVVALTPLGYPNEVPEPRSRKQLEEIICYDMWK